MMRPVFRLGSLAALVGLVILAAAPDAATTARKRPAAKKVPGDTVLVTIGGKPVTRADVQARLDEIPEASRGQFATPEGRQQLIDRIIEERVWLQMAQKMGVSERPAVRQQIEQQRRDLLIRTWLQEVMASNPAPSDSDAKVYYDQHLDDYRTAATVTLRHIQSKSEADAKRVLAAARKGEDWAKLAQRWSTDSLSRANGGALGTVTREGAFATLGRQPAIAESAMAMTAGGIAGPFRTDKGWHVIRVDEVRPEGTRPFDSVRPMILRQLSSQKAQEFYRLKLEEARKELGVTPDSSAIRNFVSQKKPAREMFREAQEIGPPAQRIAAYQALLKEYPDSEVSPQAQFMVGFIYSEELKDYDQADAAFKELLRRYPQSELAASAKWMVEHMRSEDAPAMAPLEADSSRAAGAAGSAGKP